MLFILLGIYLGLLAAFYGTTVILIVTKRNFSDLPLAYVKAIEFVQSQLTKSNCDTENNNNNEVVIGKQHLTPASITNMRSDVFEISTELIKSGIECILQDDIQRPFSLIPSDYWLLMSLPPRPDFHLQAIYAISVVFRWGVLFPIRIAFLLTALLWALSTGLYVSLTPSKVSKQTMLYFGITFAKFMRASIGSIVRGHETHNRPKKAGIAVANHMTANDVFSIYGDCSYTDVGYSVTGQKHGGLAGILEKLGQNLTPALWMDREDMKDRASFQKKVINYASNPDVFPVLLFPEGYCSNNMTVLQFRKAVFTGEVPIYPIAVVQNSRVGNVFWQEDTFIPYIIRIMTSFANVLDLYYLPQMNKRNDEDSAAFAGRVQAAIATKIGIPALPYDGGLKREKNRTGYKAKIQEAIFNALKQN